MCTPKVSILIPVFNREAYIADCIMSAQMQTVSDIEIIVVDNASTDRTYDICWNIAINDRRVRLLRNKTNLGPVRNWLTCLEHAKAPITKILWSDDLIAPTFLERLLPFLDNPSVGFVYSSAITFESQQNGAINELFASMETGIYESKRFINRALFGGGIPYSPGCAIFRRHDLKDNLLMHVKNRVNSDFSMHAIGNDLLLFLLTAAKYPNFAVVRSPLSSFRVHRNSITIAAPRGRVALHYNIAKGFFAENQGYDQKSLKKLNTKFFIDLIRFRTDASAIGIQSVSDFYPTNSFSSLDLSFFITRICSFLRSKFVLR